MKRQKKYNKTAQIYAEKLRKKGYSIKFNWTDSFSGFYEDVTIRGAKFNGYGSEFSTPKKAYQYINR